MEVQGGGNGETLKEHIGMCRCDFCQEHSEYWEAFSHLMDALATMLMLCVNNNHLDAYNWLTTHCNAVFQAAREQLEEQQKPERFH